MELSATFLEPNSPYVGVRIRPGPRDQAHRTPYHLALLIDTSGSMNGERMETVKRTLHLLVDHLSPDDQLTLIGYSSTSQILCEGCSDRETLRRSIETLEAQGGTNLEAGILQFATVYTRISNKPTAVFLLTDGQVNEGISSTVGIRSLFNGFLPRHVSINTLGYGADHNSDLLQALAVQSRGTYTFADEAETIPAIIGTIVGGMENEVAQDATLGWDEGQCMELGWEEGTHSYCIGNLIAEKEQWAVLYLPTTTASIRLTWLEGSDRKEETIPVHRSEEYQPHIAEQVYRSRTVKLLAKPIGEQSEEDIDDLLQEIRNSPVSTRTLVLSLLAKLEEMRSLLRIPPMPQFPPRFGLQRCMAVAYDTGTISQLRRLTSGVTTFGLQRGISNDPTSFVSPQQAVRMTQLVTEFTQHDPEPQDSNP
jgi:hypothetical protein